MRKSFFTALGVALLLAAPAVAANPAMSEPLPMPGSSEWSGSYMGIDIQEVSHDRMTALKLKEERGAEITMVDHDAPAGQAGLREHDVILEFNGARVQGTEELRRLIHETPPGRTVQMTISRDGQPMNISLQLADKKQYFSKKMDYHEMPPMPPIPAMPAMPAVEATVHTNPSYGLMVDNLTPQLGEFFGVKNGEGVLVKSVEEGTPGKAAGFRAGDVIVRVNNQKVADRGEWRSAIRANRSGKLTVGIVRDRREQNLTISLPETSRNHSWMHVPPAIADLDLNLDLGQLQAELQALGPEIEQARALALQEAGEAMKNSREAMDLHEKEIKRAMDEARRELDREMKRWQQEMEKAGQESHQPQD